MYQLEFDFSDARPLSGSPAVNQTSGEFVGDDRLRARMSKTDPSEFPGIAVAAWVPNMILYVPRLYSTSRRQLSCDRARPPKVRIHRNTGQTSTAWSRRVDTAATPESRPYASHFNALAPATKLPLFDCPVQSGLRGRMSCCAGAVSGRDGFQ